MAVTQPRALRGRDAELTALGESLSLVASGRSAVLVVRGEAGIGKSALLDHAAGRASGCRILRAAGVESEMELPFASLHQLCAPLLDGVAALAEPQRIALNAALGRGTAHEPDRFVLGLGLLELLERAATHEPLLCLIDDAQWLDRSSAQALGFVARRIRDVPLALLFAERAEAAIDELAGLPELHVPGLPDAEARALLATAIPGPLDARIFDRIVAETHGNPLALLELPRGRSAAAVAGGLELDLPVPAQIEQSFRGQVAALPEATQRLLLVAAAEPTGDPTLLWRAIAELDVPVEAAGAAEAAGLVRIGARIAFRHPLLRSAVYRAAAPELRRAAHRALADVTDPAVDPDRRAWHRAQATLGHDDDVADELARAADRAHSRGGFPAAAAFLERATALTLDPARRPARALATAQATYEAGAFAKALDFIRMAEAAGGLGELDRARATLVRGQISFADGHFSAAVPLLLEAAVKLEHDEPDLARDTYRAAFHAAFAAGRFRDGGGTERVAAAFRAAPPVPHPDDHDPLLDGMAFMLLGDLTTGAPRALDALEALRDQALAPRDALARLPLAARMAINVFDFDSWDVLSARLVDVARATGAVGVLPIALTLRIANRLLAGELEVADRLNAEIVAIGDLTGRSFMGSYGTVALAAWRGDRAVMDEAIAAGEAPIVEHGAGQWLTTTQWARAVLLNGEGRFADALVVAEQARAYPAELSVALWAQEELIEAAALSGDHRRAASGLEELVPLTQAAGTDWALGIEARARGLVAGDETAEALLRESVARLQDTGARLGFLRSHLLLGEWLRRAGRRSDARLHLRTARDAFAAMGATVFAARADRSLQATGERTRVCEEVARDDLTAQERQIAGLARDGLSNPEIGARLFISPRTVEYHLSKVFGKLGISSRVQLDRALPVAGDRTTPGASFAR